MENILHENKNNTIFYEKLQLRIKKKHTSKTPISTLFSHQSASIMYLNLTSYKKTSLLILIQNIAWYSLYFDI